MVSLLDFWGGIMLRDTRFVLLGNSESSSGGVQCRLVVVNSNSSSSSSSSGSGVGGHGTRKKRGSRGFSGKAVKGGASCSLSTNEKEISKQGKGFS